MGTHPIFESDFDCLTVMSLLNLARSRIVCRNIVRKINVTQPTLVAAPVTDDTERVYSEKVTSLVDQIAGLTLQEVADLNSALKKRLNISEVSYAAPMAAAAPVAAASDAPAEDEEEKVEEVEKVQTEFTLTMTAFDEKSKIKVIKAIKANMPDFNLVAAKKFIEALPKVVRKDVDKEEAEKVKAVLEAEGATIEMK